MDDEARMRRVAAGDAQAFGEIVHDHQAQLLRFASRMLGDRDAAQDIVQEAFLRLWKARERYRSQPGGLNVFLLRIARNLCLDYHRAHVPTLPLEPALHTGLKSASPEADAESRALADAVQRALQALPESQRVVFILSHYEQLSYREISVILDCPLGTIASRKAAAVEALRRRLVLWEQE